MPNVFDRPTLITCTFADTGLTIGWVKLVRQIRFRDWIDYRMAAGFTYLISGKDAASYEVRYNKALKINRGVDAQELRRLVHEMEDDSFLADGDISLLRLGTAFRYARMAETAQEVLDYHTLEMPPAGRRAH